MTKTRTQRANDYQNKTGRQKMTTGYETVRTAELNTDGKQNTDCVYIEK